MAAHEYDPDDNFGHAFHAQAGVDDDDALEHAALEQVAWQFLLLVNPDAEDCDFMLPAGVWQAVLDTAHPRGVTRWQGQGEAPLPLPAHSLMLLVAAGAKVQF